MSPSWLPATGLTLPLLAGAAVVLLYLLRPPPRSVEVPSLLLWRRIAERRRSHELLRRLLSALLSLAVALALALALGGLPRLPRRGEAQLVVVDDTATMATEVAPGTTRLDLARRRARELAAAWPGPTLYADTTGRSAPYWARTERGAVRWLSSLSVSPARGRLPAMAGVGGAVTEGTPRRFLVTDGVAIDAPDGWQVESVYAPAINVGWIAFAAATSSGSNAVEAYLEVLNASTSAAKTRVVVASADGRTLVDRELELGARESWSGLLDIPAAAVNAGARLLGRLETAGDALSRDDTASISIAARPRISIGTIGVTGALDRALRLLPNVSVTALASDATATGMEAAGPGAFDLLVASNWAPREPPSIPALLVAPPSREWLPEPTETLAAATVRVREPGRRDWGPVELAGVRRYVAGDEATQVGERMLVGQREPPNGAGATASDELQLVFEVGSAPAPTIVAAVELDEAAITRHEAFPVLIARIVDELVEVLVEELAAELPGGRTNAAPDEVVEDEPQELGARLSDVNASGLPFEPSRHGSGAEASGNALQEGGDSPGRRVVAAMLLAALAFSVLETWSRSRGFTE